MALRCYTIGKDDWLSCPCLTLLSVFKEEWLKTYTFSCWPFPLFYNSSCWGIFQLIIAPKQLNSISILESHKCPVDTFVSLVKWLCCVLNHQHLFVVVKQIWEVLLLSLGGKQPSQALKIWRGNQPCDNWFWLISIILLFCWSKRN